MSSLIQFRHCRLAAILILFWSVAAWTQTSPTTPDIPQKFEPPTVSYDYERRDAPVSDSETRQHLR